MGVFDFCQEFCCKTASPSSLLRGQLTCGVFNQQSLFEDSHLQAGCESPHSVSVSLPHGVFYFGFALFKLAPLEIGMEPNKAPQKTRFLYRVGSPQVLEPKPPQNS